MTEQDIQATQDAALGRYMRLKRTRAVAHERIEAVASQMAACAADLRQGARKVGSLAFEAPPWLNSKVVCDLIADLQTAETEMQRARERVVALGVALEANQ